MKQYYVYVCEFCGRESRVQDDILTCEQEHELEWNKLRQAVSRTSHTLSHINNQENREKYDAAIDAILTFEKTYHI